MMFWILLGLAMVIPSLIFMSLRYIRGDKHVDSQLTSLFDWPLLATGVLTMIPTWIWWDFTVGLVAMIAWEGYKFMQAKRKHAEHNLAQALKEKIT